MFSNVWTAVRASDSTYQIDVDNVINRLAVDIQERMDQIIGNSRWSSGTDPIVDGTVVKSLIALKAQIDASGLIMNATANRIPKKKNATEFEDTVLEGTADCVTLKVPKHYVHVRKAAQTIIAGAALTFDIEEYDNWGLFDPGVSTSRFTMTSGLTAGLWLVFGQVFASGSIFNGQQFYFRKNGTRFGGIFKAQDEYTISMNSLVELATGDYIDMYYDTGSNLAIAETRFYMVRLY